MNSFLRREFVYKGVTIQWDPGPIEEGVKGVEFLSSMRGGLPNTQKRESYTAWNTSIVPDKVMNVIFLKVDVDGVTLI